MTCVDGALRCRVRCRSASGFGRPSRCRDDTTPHPTHVKLGSIRESGRPDSNQRPPRPKRGALTRLSYAPLPDECTHCVAVRAHQLALCDLLEHTTRLFLRQRSATEADFSKPGRWSHCMAAG